MNLRLFSRLKLCNGVDYFSLLTLKLEVVPGAVLDPFNLVNLGHDDLMDVTLMMSLTNGTEAWSTSLSLDFFQKSAAQIEMSIGNYMDLTIKALTNAIDGKYSYEIAERDKNTARFSWKEKMTNDEITIKLGSCVLRAEDITKATCLMLSFSNERVSELEKQTKTSEAEIERLKNDRERAVKSLEKFVGEKEALEKDLYSKFVVVLNEKKQKIRELQEYLREDEDMETTKAPATQVASDKPKRPATKKWKKVKVVPGTSVGTSEFDSGSETDVEASPKTSKKTLKNPPEDDLLLDNSQNDSFSFKPRKKTKK